MKTRVSLFIGIIILSVSQLAAQEYNAATYWKMEQDPAYTKLLQRQNTGEILSLQEQNSLAEYKAKLFAYCEKLGMTKFIEELPHGFNTYLGENGAALSGGQQQRIAIARALYRNPEILILDEATSSLDSVSETFVQNTLRLLREENKTVIVIAHRLSTINLAQRVIILEKGKVVQDGTFAELSVIDGQFRRMWMPQTIETQESINV